LKIVLDANIIISSLIHNSAKRAIINLSEFEFYYPEDAKKEIDKYKEEIIEKSGLDEESYSKIYSGLFEGINLIPIGEIDPFVDKAREIMDKIDPKDTLFIASALSLNCPIWTDDSHFKKQDKVKILSQRDILRLIEDNR
jgi:predicted nucleic acid-binding protein